MRSGFVEASPSRDFRDGESKFVASHITKLMPNVFVRLALLDLISEQCQRPINEVHKFSVRGSNEQCRNQRQMQNEHASHRCGGTKNECEHACQCREPECHEKYVIHPHGTAAFGLPIAPQLEPDQTRSAN